MNGDTPIVVGGGIIAILGIILALFGVLRTKPGVLVPSPVETKEEEIAQKKIDEAKVKEVINVQKAKDDHDKVIDNLIAKEEKQAEKAEDGEDTNAFLKDIGSKVKS